MKLDIQTCPICKSPSKVKEYKGGEKYNISCPRCGFYHITDSALTMYQRSKVEDKLQSVSYWVRQHQFTDNLPILIDEGQIRSLLVPFITTKPNEQVEILLLWLGDSLRKPSEIFEEPLNNLISLVGGYDIEDVEYIISFLIKKGYINSDSLETTEYIPYLRANLTFKGWDRYYELQRLTKDSRLVFMAMQYGNENLDRIFNDVIKDAVSKTGFEIRKLDEERRAGLIDDKLRVEIRRSKFLIADLSDDNNGAYWEAGYAEGLGMQVIYICEEEKFKAKKTHFDTNHHLTIQWKDDPDSLNNFAEELKATIRATFPTEATMEDN